MTNAHRISALSFALFATALPGSALAADHDRGFYFRAGLGVGYTSDSFDSETVGIAGAASGKIEGTLAGFGGASELALGGAIAKNLILGGGIYSTWFSPSTSSVSVSGQVLGFPANVTADADIDFKASSFHVIGPFLDYYLDDDAGFHVQGAAGLAIFTLGDFDGTSAGGHTAAGFGLMGGVGYEWSLSRKFALGVLGRLTFGATKGSSDDDILDWSHTAIAPALLLSATYN